MEAKELNIGLVSPIEVYHNAPQGEKSVQRLQLKLKPRADELQRKQEDLVEKQKALQTNLHTLTKSDVGERQKILVNEQDKFKREAIAFREVEIKQEQKIAQDFQLSFDDAVKSVAIENKYDLVLNSQAIAYALGSLKMDITNQVVERMKSEVRA